ncbi:hypothetical protein [Actinokineospora bangkokensis]|uniref:Uncharacterized protein n=1 Tax=Actinokineospora bangkokensis TaxID=1193682 RepID=A0A1Q9LIF6_9PSEU|nr:hypothetical protein [Actinokineospora bangkokensis]OLR91832.1 hypothetical protein BJP25_23620 [Actinokineospora bangkokensis]
MTPDATTPPDSDDPAAAARSTSPAGGGRTGGTDGAKSSKFRPPLPGAGAPVPQSGKQLGTGAGIGDLGKAAPGTGDSAADAALMQGFGGGKANTTANRGGAQSTNG